MIKKQMAEGVAKRRVGFVSSGAPARQHTEIRSADGSKVCARAQSMSWWLLHCAGSLQAQGALFLQGESGCFWA